MLTLTGSEAHHALHVLRIRKGERLVALDGAGSEILCEVHDCTRDSFTLTVMSRNRVPPLPYRITLLQAIPKGKTFETIIQKATELGVGRIVPLLSERTAIQAGDRSAPARTEKWRRVAMEAIKQCGNPWLPEIEKPVALKEFLSRHEKFELPLIASLQPDRRHPREYFGTFLREHGRLPQSVCVWIGPEGDFTPAELGDIETSGAFPISLGRLTLRSDTAAICCLAILNHELGPDCGSAGTRWQ